MTKRYFDLDNLIKLHSSADLGRSLIVRSRIGFSCVLAKDT